jgi:hypothetical protein
MQPLAFAFPSTPKNTVEALVKSKEEDSGRAFASSLQVPGTSPAVAPFWVVFLYFGDAFAWKVQDPALPNGRAPQWQLTGWLPKVSARANTLVFEVLGTD